MKKLNVMPTVATDIAAAQTELDILLCRRGLNSFTIGVITTRNAHHLTSKC